MARCGATAVGTAVGVGAVLAGSPTFVIVRVLGHHNAFQQVLCRSPFFLGVVGCMALVRWGRDHSGRDGVLGCPARCGAACRTFGWMGCVGSFFLGAQSLAIVVSLLLTKMSNVAFIINTSPVFCGLIDTFVLRETVPLRTKVMMLMGLVCVCVILAGDVDANPRYTAGNLIALVNPLSWAIFWAITRRKNERARTSTVAHTKQVVAIVGEEEDGTRTTNKWDDLVFVQLVSGLVVATVGTIGTLASPDVSWGRNTNNTTTSETTPGTMSMDDWWMYLLYGGVILPITVLLFSAAPLFISTTLMGCIKQLEMVLIPIYGYLYDGEVPRTQAIIGASLLVATLLVHSVLEWREDDWKKKKKRTFKEAKTVPPDKSEDDKTTRQHNDDIVMTISASSKDDEI
jgi:drug/metabolite transporter (DMT)-like permease